MAWRKSILPGPPPHRSCGFGRLVEARPRCRMVLSGRAFQLQAHFRSYKSRAGIVDSTCDRHPNLLVRPIYKKVTIRRLQLDNCRSTKSYGWVGWRKRSSMAVTPSSPPCDDSAVLRAMTLRAVSHGGCKPRSKRPSSLERELRARVRRCDSTSAR